MSQELRNYASRHLASHSREAKMFANIPPVNKEEIIGNTLGVMTILLYILSQPAFQAAGEDLALKLFVVTTSDDPTKPLKGGELWEAMKRKFPAERGGIDTESIIRTMAQRAMGELLK